jgi:GPH family glycoside/pentoside/hexuronide:cation symporter
LSDVIEQSNVQADRLPGFTTVGYAFAETGINLVETVLRIYLLIYYTDVVGLHAGLAGLAVGIGLVWDAVTDPIMGAISDRTRDRFGGRRGYLPPGGVLLAVGLLGVFWPPELASQAAKFAWLLGSFCFLNTGMTVLSVPYMAMAGELTQLPHERAVLFGWRFAFMNLGALLAASLPALFLAPGVANAATMRPVAVCGAVLVVVATLVSWLATAGVPCQGPPSRAIAWSQAFAAPLRNAAFRPLLLAYVTATVGIGLNSATVLYYYQYRLHLTEAQVQSILVVFLVVFTLSILVWVHLARKHGRRLPMAIGASLLGVGTAVLYTLAGPGSYWLVLLVGGVVLGGLVGCIVLIDTQLTFVIDHDLVHNREPRAGQFFGVWRFASKLARAAAIGAAGLVLDLAGFVPNAVQSAGVEQALWWLFGPGVGACFLLAGIVIANYRFEEQKQAQVQRILARRQRRALASTN